MVGYVVRRLIGCLIGGLVGLVWLNAWMAAMVDVEWLVGWKVKVGWLNGWMVS